MRYPQVCFDDDMDIDDGYDEVPTFMKTFHSMTRSCHIKVVLEA
jgi:hypothetical protein